MRSKFYLKNLVLQNFATFKFQSIDFGPGFNAIVGETGSGKSLVMDALQIILGARTDKKLIRKGAEFSLVEATFFCGDKEIINFLESQGYPLQDEVILIKRLFYKNGSSKAYINHLSTTASFLGHFSEKHIDLVGQFENQRLLSEDYQLKILDQYAKHSDQVDSYQKKFNEFKSLLKRHQELVESKITREKQIDFLNYQINEIQEINPTTQDENELLRKKETLVNFERIKNTALQAKSIFDGSDSIHGLSSQLNQIKHLLLKNTDIFTEQVERFLDAQENINDLLRDIEKKSFSEPNENELELIIDRLDLYQKLRRKFGGTTEEILKTKETLILEKQKLEDIEDFLNQITDQKEKEKNDLQYLANEIHLKRLVMSEKLGQELTTMLRDLKMPGATLVFELQRLKELGESGTTKAFLMAETNPGEGYFKVKDIASGGELSRILLAFRKILSATDSISIFLFDEIDTGIGGETATCIGKALEDVSKHGQVIAITHLPQIAQFAQTLIRVDKEVYSEKEDSRTESLVKIVSGKNRSKEIRTMAQLA